MNGFKAGKSTKPPLAGAGCNKVAARWAGNDGPLSFGNQTESLGCCIGCFGGWEFDLAGWKCGEALDSE